MSDTLTEHATCPFSGQGVENINIKFFRGSRNDIITADEILEQARSAVMQGKMGTARRSKMAPMSGHPKINVTEFVTALQR